MLRLVGYLVTLLAIARFLAPVPSDAHAQEAASHSTNHAATSSAPDSPDATPTSTTDGGEAEPVLLEVVFRPGVVDGSLNPVDLRNPFQTRRVRAASEPRDRKRRAKATRVRHDLRDPFSIEPRKQQRDAAPDLRNPFVKPTRTLPKCPDTGGVPIQRPDSLAPGCATASRHVVVAKR
ncbi:MAG: hypothetical protein ACE37F_37875 [Nannocystaceae bacterium]|nr:hypothetical protein [bacterium]